VLEYPPHSPDLAPCDFSLFPNIKEILKGMHFDDVDDIRSNMTVALKFYKTSYKFVLKGELGAGTGA
jgi:hypothetical protein